MTKKEVQKFLKESVNTLLTTDYTCCRLDLDEKLAIYVGWSGGYGHELRDDVIQDPENPDWAINAGIKVSTSDYMQTDYDFLNFPYETDGEVWDEGLSLNLEDEKDNYSKIAEWFLKDYEELKKLNITEKGEIIRGKNN